ncbi:unnamed protein product [Closterium sp. NIES-53]
MGVCQNIIAYLFSSHSRSLILTQRQADPHPQREHPQSPRGQHRLPDDKSPLHPPGQLQLQNQKLQLQLQHPQNQKLQCLLQLHPQLQHQLQLQHPQNQKPVQEQAQHQPLES